MLRVLMTPARRTVRVGLVGTLATLVAGLAACGGGKKPNDGPPAIGPSPTSTLSPAQADAASKALAAYNGYIATLNSAAQTGTDHEAELRKYIGDPLLADTLYFLSQMRKAGLIQSGEPSYAPRLEEINVDKPFKNVIITDCVDSTNMTLVYKASGSPAPVVSPSASPRLKVSVEAVLYDDGRWLIRKSTPVEGATC